MTKKQTPLNSICMTPDEMKKLVDSIYQVGDTWLKDAKKITDSIPYVQQAVQIAQQFSTSFNNIPDTVDTGEWKLVTSALIDAQNVLNYGAPSAGNTSLSAAISGSALITLAGTHATGLLNYSAARAEDPKVQSWANTNLIAFEKLYDTDGNKAFIRTKLKTLHAGSEAEFDEALAEYAKVLSNAIAPSGAAIAMRNVLESLNGHLLEFARNTSGLKPQQVRKWEDITNIMARGAPKSAETTQLLTQKSLYDMLHDTKLTKIAKNDWVPIQAEWETLMTEFLGFLYTVLGLVDLKDGA